MALSKTVFSGKGDDELLTQDIYGVKDSSAKNAFKSITSADKNLAGMVGSLKKNGGGIKDLLGKGKDLAKKALVTAQDLKNIKDAIGQGPAGALSALDNSLVKKVADNLSIKPELINNVKMVVGDVTTLMSGDFKSVSGITNIMQGLGSSQTLAAINLSEQVGVVKGMVDMVADSGAVEIFDLVKSDAAIADILPRALETKIGSIALNTGVKGVEKVAEITGYENLGKDSTVFKKTLQGYANNGATMVEYSTEIARTIQAFGQIDGGWDKVSSDPRGIDRLDHFVGLSGDVVEAMRHEPVLGEQHLAASLYGKANMVDELKTMYKGVSV